MRVLRHPKTGPVFLLAVVLWLVSRSIGSAQGLINFDNHVPGAVVAPFYGLEPICWSHLRGNATTNGGSIEYHGALLTGTAYTAQLWGGPAGTPEDQLVLIATAYFRTSPEFAGFIQPPATAPTVPGVPAGAMATFQLRVWDNYGGTLTTWTEAFAAWSVGWTVLGSSEPFTPPEPLGGPPRLSAITLISPQGIRLDYETSGSGPVTVFSTSDLSDPNWINFGTSDNGQFLDNAPLDQQRFYRLSQSPPGLVGLESFNLTVPEQEFFALLSVTDSRVAIGGTATLTGDLFICPGPTNILGPLLQWYRGGGPNKELISGATNLSLIITNAQFSDAGDYTLLLLNTLNFGYRERTGSLTVVPELQGVIPRRME